MQNVTHTKPSRSQSKGREASCGEELNLVDKALDLDRKKSKICVYTWEINDIPYAFCPPKEETFVWKHLERVRLSISYLENPAMDRASMLDSVPPATITSASPNWIILVASPIECAPVAQAVTAAWFGPYIQKHGIAMQMVFYLRTSEGYSRQVMKENSMFKSHITTPLSQQLVTIGAFFLQILKGRVA